MCIISVKVVTYIFVAETCTCINVGETSNCITITETFTFIITTKRSSNIIVAESNTIVTAIEPQNLHNYNRRWHLRNCYTGTFCKWKFQYSILQLAIFVGTMRLKISRNCQLHSSNKNCQLKNWLQKLLLAEIVPVRDTFGYNEET